MAEEIITFCDYECNKQKFHQHKNITLLEDVVLITY